MVRILLLLLLCIGDIMAERLSAFIRHYEPVLFTQLTSQPRFKRSADSGERFHVRFHGMGRYFHLILQRDTSSFAKNFVTVRNNRTILLNISHIYSGKLAGDPNSRAFGTLQRGIFEGRIQAGDGSEYYIEPGRRYFGKSVPINFCVIYSARDIDLPLDVDSRGGCGVDRLYQRFVPPKNSWKRQQGIRRHKRAIDYVEFPAMPIHHKNRSRTMESSSRRLCHLEIIVDHTLYLRFLVDDDDSVAQERVAALVASLVHEVSYIFGSTNFGGIVGVRFNVMSLKIKDSHTCDGRQKQTNPYCSDTLDANDMLSLISAEQHDDFCLSFTLTYREFSQGTLGLAYIGYPDDRVGGICEKFRTLQLSGGPRQLSLNTGIVTFLNHGSSIPQKVSETTFAHEIGHTFGAKHDKSRVCAPGGVKGNFIMYPRASSGYLENNRLFSPCSISSISAVLKAVLYSLYEKENCFLASATAFCGNKMREEEEECDCGYNTADCRDQCCYPRNNKENAKGCTLRPDVDCSPSAGTCCNKNCAFLGSSHRCSFEDECSDGSNCNSFSSQCPARLPKQDLIPCNKETQVCIGGQCQGSICIKYGYEACQLSGSQYSLEEMCTIRCRVPNSTSTCLDPCEVPVLQPLCGRKSEPGAACNDNMGYCDVFHKCRGIDEEGPLTRIEGLIFRHSGMLHRWVKDNKWAVAAFCVVLVFGVVTFIRCCAVVTPSSNPHFRPALSIKQSLTHPSDLWRSGIKSYSS
ncbi:disintegrin and metalloproteinase domain-containing protein 10-like isoform X2 [Ornithodoros turicata]|uniref:disintegrin and metalloproteinase domain-containing protein 10-like isoform X2 n=1 Tax=Ornithodoros turicata TaxID=34597 RepID=UPI00313992E6